MKVTKAQLKQIIKEEVQAMNEWNWKQFKKDIGLGPEPEPEAEPEAAPPSEEETARMRAEEEKIREDIIGKVKYVGRVIGETYDLIMNFGSLHRPCRGCKNLHDEFGWDIYNMLQKLAPLRTSKVKAAFAEHYNELMDEVLAGTISFTLEGLVGQVERLMEKAYKLEGSNYRADEESKARVKAFQDRIERDKEHDWEWQLKRHEGLDRKVKKNDLQRFVKKILKTKGKK